MLLFPVDKIVITDRARTELGENFEQLKQSIEKRGLINPLCVSKEDNELVAGFRRLTCCTQLGYKKVQVKFYEDLSPLEKKILELEENIHEKLTWDEQAKLRTQIHLLHQEIHGSAVKGHESDGWGLEKTAELLNVSPATLSQDVTLTEAVKLFPSIAKKASRRQALKAIDKAHEIAILTELARREAEDEHSKFSQLPYIMYHGDAVEVIKKNIEDATVDLVFFDPPWGIDIHKIGNSRGPRGEKTSYKDDSEETAVNLIVKLLPEIHRVMKADAHMYMFIGAQYRDFYYNILTKFELLEKRMHQMISLFPIHRLSFISVIDIVEEIQEYRDWSFHVEEIPLIWVKEGGGFTDFESKFMPRYESILFCSKGEKKRLNEATSNVFEFKRPITTERIHTQEKPIELIQRLIKISSQPNEIVLDPCAGSFSTVVAATLTGRRSIGIDDDEVCYLKGLARLKGLTTEDDDDDDNDNEE